MKKLASLFVILAGTLWGSMGIFVRRLNNQGLESMEIVAIRAIFSAIILTLVLAVYDRNLLKIKWKDLWCFLGTGICSIIFFNYCYFRTIVLTDLSVAAILLYTAPSMVMVMSLVLFKEQITVQKILALICAFLGCVLVTGAIGSDVPLSLAGLLLGLGSGLGYACYTIFSRYAIQRGYTSLTITVYTFIVAALCVLPLVDMGKVTNVVISHGSNFLFMMVFAVLTTIIPYLIYTIGLNYIELGKASVIASVEPVVATLIGVVVFHESLSLWSLVGILLVLLSLVILGVKTKEKEEKKNIA